VLDLPLRVHWPKLLVAGAYEACLAALTLQDLAGASEDGARAGQAKREPKP
jgi:hypothetical protein